ncbi:MAG: hypothetical protein D6771_00135, partial [Zetaproteobacteria bacterium]
MVRKTLSIREARRARAHLIAQQRMQTWARIGFALAGIAFIELHAPFSHPELYARLARAFHLFAAGYLLYQALSFFWISRRPRALIRFVVSPALDVIAVAFGMLLDGGLRSDVFFVFFAITLGNALRYGPVMALYSTTLALVGFVVVVALSHLWGLAGDASEILWRAATLLGLSAYVNAMFKREARVRAHRRQAEAALEAV